MLNLTRIDDQNIQINEADINRVRQTEYIDGPLGKSRVDWIVSDLFNDLASDIAAGVTKKVKSFINLMQPGGKPVWFDGSKAIGPVFVSKSQKIQDKSGKINSALIIANKKQFVKNTPQEVYDAIKAQGGQAIPPDGKNVSGELAKEAKRWTSTPDIWDKELYSGPST